jgi:hypothetical protein
MIIGYARVSTTERNLGLQHDDLEPVFDASVDQTDARTATVRAYGPKTVELPFMMLLANSRQRPFGGVWTRSFALQWGNPDSWDRGLNSRAVTFVLTNLLHC